MAGTQMVSDILSWDMSSKRQSFMKSHSTTGRQLQEDNDLNVYDLNGYDLNGYDLNVYGAHVWKPQRVGPLFIFPYLYFQIKFHISMLRI